MVSYNQMPAMLESMLKQEGMVLRQKDVLIGGQGLCGHSLDANVKELLHAEKWSYVILQDHYSRLTAQDLSDHDPFCAWHANSWKLQ